MSIVAHTLHDVMHFITFTSLEKKCILTGIPIKSPERAALARQFNILTSTSARTHTLRVLKLGSLIAHGLRIRDNTRPRDYSTRRTELTGISLRRGLHFARQNNAEREREREGRGERRVLSADVPPSSLTSRAYNTCRDRVCARCVPLHLSEVVSRPRNSANAVFIEEVTPRDVREYRSSCGVSGDVKSVRFREPAVILRYLKQNGANIRTQVCLRRGRIIL